MSSMVSFASQEKSNPARQHESARESAGRIQRCGTSPCRAPCHQKRTENSPRIRRSPSTIKLPSTIPATIDEVLRHPGQRLPDGERTYMEALLGHDFANVVVHTGPAAAESAGAISATAYTVGHHVVFGGQVPAHTTAQGRRLLAHELTHVVQQRGMPASGDVTLGEPGDIYEREAERAAADASANRGLTSPLSPSAAPGLRVQRDEPGTLGSDQIVVRAVHVTPQEFFLMTGIDPASVPDHGGGTATVSLDAATVMGQPVAGPTGQIPPQSPMSYGLGLPLARMGMPASPIPLNATGFMWGSGHLSIFANVDGNLTMRGFRAPLATHAAADIIGGPFTERLNVGTVQGTFAEDLFFSTWPFQNQTIVFRSADPGAARDFAAALRSAEYNTAYRYSPPLPGSEAFERLYPQGNPCPTANCLTVPAREVELALGRPMELPTPGGIKNLQTGAVAGGPPSPTEAGRASEMRSYLDQPTEFFTRQGLTRAPGQPFTMGARATVPYIRAGGWILLIYGVYRTGDRLHDAWGTEEFPVVAAEEAGGWTGGLLGSVAAGAVAGAILCAPTGPIDVVCVVGGALAGLIGGMIGGTVGAMAGRTFAEEARSVLGDMELGIRNLYGVPWP